MSKPEAFPVLLLAAPVVLPLAVAAGAVAAAGAGLVLAARLAEAVGSEIVARIGREAAPERLATPGRALQRFTTPIPIETLARGAVYGNFELAGQAMLGVDGARPETHLLIARDGQVVLAVRPTGQSGCELLVPADTASVAAELGAAAVAQAMIDEAAAQSYSLAMVPVVMPGEIRLAARRRRHADERIVVASRWDGSSRLDVRVESAAADVTGLIACPEIDGFLARLGRRREMAVAEEIVLPPGGPASQAVNRPGLSREAHR